MSKLTPEEEHLRKHIELKNQAKMLLALAIINFIMIATVMAGIFSHIITGWI